MMSVVVYVVAVCIGWFLFIFDGVGYKVVIFFIMLLLLLVSIDTVVYEL
jgi:hypothetical protein